LIKKEPAAEKFILPLISAKEFLHGENRWCLWLVEASSEDLNSMPEVKNRIKKVKEMREASVDSGARQLAMRPYLFRDLKNPDSYILIPAHTSENRKYIPIAYFNKNQIPHNSCQILPSGKLFHFGIISSIMHVSWVKYTCGRLESRIRYSKDIVYNNFPWPENPSEKHIKAIELAAQKVIDTRAELSAKSLSSIYDPLVMPLSLTKAHQELDKAVDLAYRPQPFVSEAKRMEFLFDLYEKYTSGLFGIEPKKKK
jgi:hypothetical protein